MGEGATFMSEAQLHALRGHRFPGGVYRIAHWENWLLTDCTGREPMPDGLAHPVVLFHAPILGAGTSIGELFALGGATGDAGSVGLLGYDWEYAAPLREEVDYDVQGGVVDTERRTSPSGTIDDHLAFRIEMREGSALVARVTNRWRFRRVGGTAGRPASPTAGSTESAVLAELPEWVMPSVDAARMKTMAAILRDPYPVHWDREANAQIGLPGRVVNQGPLNLGYVANMLMAWAGPASVRRLTVAFGAPVLDEDRVVAGGAVRTSIDGVAYCDVWLTRDGTKVVTGTAEVTVPT